MIWQIFLGLLRHLLTTAGGALVAQGYLDQDQVPAAAGALMTLIAIGWSAAHKTRPQTLAPPENPLPAVASAPGDTADDLNRAEALLLRQEHRD